MPRVVQGPKSHHCEPRGDPPPRTPTPQMGKQGYPRGPMPGLNPSARAGVADRKLLLSAHCVDTQQRACRH